MPANASQNETPLSTWALDREIVLSRVINAPRELVFSAWADPRHLPQWYPPAGVGNNATAFGSIVRAT